MTNSDQSPESQQTQTAASHLESGAKRIKHPALILVLLCFAMPIVAADLQTVNALVGREFSVEDHWAGQELAFARKGQTLVAVCRTQGSGLPVLVEEDYPIKVKSQQLCVFVLARKAKRYEVKSDLTQRGEVRAYLDGIRIYIKEKKPNLSSESATPRDAAHFERYAAPPTLDTQTDPNERG